MIQMMRTLDRVVKCILCSHVVLQIKERTGCIRHTLTLPHIGGYDIDLDKMRLILELIIAA